MGNPLKICKDCMYSRTPFWAYLIWPIRPMRFAWCKRPEAIRRMMSVVDGRAGFFSCSDMRRGSYHESYSWRNIEKPCNEDGRLWEPKP